MKLSLKDVKLSRFTWMSMSGAGILFLIWLALTLFTGEGPKKVGEAKKDKSKCSICNRPLPKDAQLTGDCPYCKMENPEAFATAKKARENGGVFSGQTIPVVLISMVCILLCINIALFVRAKITNKPDDEMFYVHCFKCKRKVRYRSGQVGKFARCPCCRELMRFPALPDEPKGRWGTMIAWLKRPKKKPRTDSA